MRANPTIVYGMAFKGEAGATAIKPWCSTTGLMLIGNDEYDLNIILLHWYAIGMDVIARYFPGFRTLIVVMASRQCPQADIWTM
mmetsp:Transcript_46470/g.108249  ORF Transcript_46470/g.108249 Transcript_46470/m.108249 type:complete len:84 (-) Transcript_46470:2231-2482(-)